MDRGPTRRIVQRVMSVCLSRIRKYGTLSESEFAAAAADLPALLREAAGMLEAPPADLAAHPEMPGVSGYSLWAESYDRESGNMVVAGEEEVIWAVIGEARGLRVLDVGCGTGRHAIPLALQGARVTGYEPSPGMLARAVANARSAGVNPDLRPGGLEELPADLGEFDLVLCCLVLSHVQDLAGAVARLARHVAPGGRLVVSDFHPINLIVGFRTSFSHHGTKYVVPNALHLPSEYFQAMAGAGLQVESFLEPGREESLPDVPQTLVMAGRRPPAPAGAGDA